ncbi:hypothetical protein AM593_09011, partial [Mytilus galloprovincialis]
LTGLIKQLKDLGMETQLFQVQAKEALQIVVKGRIIWKGNIKALSGESTGQENGDHVCSSILERVSSAIQ